MIFKLGIVTLALGLSACAVPVQIGYNVVSAGTLATTSKGIPDHALSLATRADCNFFNVLQGLYYCEERDESKTYNRNSF
jgi:hypothetical protein